MVDYPIIDGDQHAVEPDDIWEKYLDEEYKSWYPLSTPRQKKIPSGQNLLMVEGKYQHLKDGKHLYYPGAKRWAVEEKAPGQYDIKYEGKRWTEGGWDPHIRMKDMGAEGIDIMVLYPTQGLFLESVEDPGFAAALARAYNNWLYDHCKAYPDRIIGAALVSRKDIDEAVREARRAVTQLGFRGVMLRPNPINGRTLDDPYNYPLFDELQRLGVPLCIHEAPTFRIPNIYTDRFNAWWPIQVVSFTMENMLACLSLIAGGVLERFPRLKVVFLENDCWWIPGWLERMDGVFELWGFTTPHLKLKPSEYFMRQCYITCEAEESLIPMVVDKIGAERLMYISDYPHTDYEPGSAMELAQRKDLSDSVKRQLLCDTAVKLYGLKLAGKRLAVPTAV